MAPKKKEVEEPKPILGRFKSNLKMGIVGLPNVGKSTLFNTLTKMGIPAENFPFCTIEPNHARVNVPDDRFLWLCETYKPKSQVPAFLEVVDIAGLVKGAAEGEGLGNAFLSHISQVDGIFHVCRGFDDPEVTHVEDRIDPVADLEIIHQELRLKDIERVSNIIKDIEAMVKRGLTKEQKEDLACAQKVLEWLEAGKDIRFGTWNLRETDFLNSNPQITAKPVVYLINLSEKNYKAKKSKWLPKLFEWVQARGGEPIIPFSGAYESKLFDMPDDEKEAYIKEVHGGDPVVPFSGAFKSELPDRPAEKEAYVKESGVPSALPKIITTGFKAIQLIYFFTAGEDEVKCWQIRKGYKAPQAAGTIHTDFERGFICAEVMHYDELKELGSEAAVKAAGKYRQEGKNYTVTDGDVIFFKFNVTSSGKK
ncbi:hypothetical protein WJX72_006384 [[Myrmecia] bisecta]|uniref:Obg-like ATPase 1 n=1 Tax=[Myrmecia] bisecta TaxID=41462 RepID=A0AAW1P967_9CHLO